MKRCSTHAVLFNGFAVTSFSSETKFTVNFHRNLTNFDRLHDVLGTTWFWRKWLWLTDTKLTQCSVCRTLGSRFSSYCAVKWGTRWRSWLRHCATSRKTAGSIPDGFAGIFHWHTLSGRTTALGLTQPLTEMSTRNISWEVKASGA